MIVQVDFIPLYNAHVKRRFIFSKYRIRLNKCLYNFFIFIKETFNGWLWNILGLPTFYFITIGYIGKTWNRLFSKSSPFLYRWHGFHVSRCVITLTILLTNAINMRYTPDFGGVRDQLSKSREEWNRIYKLIGCDNIKSLNENISRICKASRIIRDQSFKQTTSFN